MFNMDENLSHSTERSKRLSLTSSKAQESDIMSIQLSQHLTKGLRQDLLLHEAAIKNDVFAAKKLIDARVDINSKSHMGRSPIHWAVSHNHTDIVELLIQAKCDIEATDKLGFRAIHLAAIVGNLQVIQMLVEAGCNCRAVNKKNFTVLNCAVKHNQNDVALYLLDNVENLEINATDKLMQSNCNPPDNPPDNIHIGQTSLHIASINNNLEIVQKLILCNANVNIKDKIGRTAAHWSSFKGHHQILSCLLRAGIETDERDEDGKTALHLAAEYGFKDVSEVLIEHNCDIFATDSKGRSALMIGAALGYLDVVSLLVLHGASLNSKDKNGNTALHLSVMGNHSKMSQFLLERGAQINSLNNRCQSPLVVAAELGYTEIAQILVNYGADLLLQEKSGRTALYVASRGSFQAIVDMLIKAERDKTNKLKRVDNKCINNYSKQSVESEEFNDFEATNHCDVQTNHKIQVNQMRKLLWNISRNHLDINDWKKLARYWDFNEEQIRAIEHQYTGKASYKDHSYRMMLIWLHGLPSCKNPLNELHDALLSINRKDVADKIKRKAEEGNLFQSQRFGCQCLPGITANLCNYCSIS